MGWAWAGATLGGYFGEQLAIEFVSMLAEFSASGMIARASAFVLGAYLGILVGEALTNVSVAAGLSGIVLGTKHALAASAGGIVGLYVSRTVAMPSITLFPELTVSAIGAAVGVVIAWILI